MTIAQTLLPEFDQEVAATRKALERIPEDKLAWKTHPKSWTVAELATHLTHIFSWVAVTMETESLDIDAQHKETPIDSRRNLLETFDRNAAAARASLAAADDGRMSATWTAKVEGKPAFAMPRSAVLRSFVFNHCIHHRGQLTVYLRLLNVPVPSIYGPSADEEPAK